MSAALQLPIVWGVGMPDGVHPVYVVSAPERPTAKLWGRPALAPTPATPEKSPVVSMAFYRKHTEKMLRRYLYASMQVGRAPSILGDPVGRGWVSSRPVRTFEDAVIFVLDVEKCLNQLGPLDRKMLSRIVLQEYTQAETATLLGMSVRTVCYRFPQAVDRLTEKLLQAGILVLPH
ncbi:MAG: sigma factor-like helix-turn-helix DNA-binding protein [Terracidiphilus sp.]